MIIQDAKKAYAAQMDTLWTRKRDLSQALKNCQQGGAPNVDRVEISREPSAVDAQYNEAQGVMESIIERETAIHNAEVAKQQGNALSKAAEEMGKMLEIYHRIASGGQVPPEDEQRLMEYNHKLYMAAKTAVLAGISGSYNTIFIVDLLLSCLPLSNFHDHSELMSAIRIFSRNIRCRHIKPRPDHLHDQAGETIYFVTGRSLRNHSISSIVRRSDVSSRTAPSSQEHVSDHSGNTRRKFLNIPRRNHRMRYPEQRQPSPPPEALTQTHQRSFRTS